MQFVKLQLGCLLIIAYVEISYIRETLRGQIPCNRYFDLLMILAPWAVFFDGLTAWTVNHMDLVPAFVNRGAHLLFFLSMDLFILSTTAYFYDQLLGFRKKKIGHLFLILPGLLSLLMIIGGFGKLTFIQGENTWYSMGFPVYVCYATVVLYYGSILCIVLAQRHFLPKEKKMEILSIILLVGVILGVQMYFPEVLLTALLPTLLLLGIYVDFENPSIQKLNIQHNEMLDGFAVMVESRDSNTGGHIRRTRAYVKLMLKKMRHDKRYRAILNREYMENVINAAPLHDIGKVSTPDSILQKPGKLTDEEFEIMKQHAAAGGDIILHSFRDISNGEFRQIAYEVARYHHEKYNGRGYPDGLKGEEIPLHSRVMAIADVFDAVSQKRCYRDAMPVEECFSIIEKGIGTDFDPNIARIFLDSADEVVALMKAERNDEA